MRLFKPRTVRNSLWPSLAIIWTFGCTASIKVKRRWRILYATIMNVFMVYADIYTINKQIPLKASIASFVFTLTPYFNIPANIVSIWSWELKGSTAVKNAILELGKLDEELKNFGVIIDHKKFMWKQLIIIGGFLIEFLLVICLQHSSIMYLHDTQISPNSYAYVIITLSIHMQSFQTLTSNLVFTMMLEAFRIRFKLVNDIFDRIAEPEDRIKVKVFTTPNSRVLDSSGEQIQECHGKRHLSSHLVMERVDRACRIHRRLMKAAQDIGDGFSLQLFANYPTFFLYTTLNVSTMISSFIDGLNDRIPLNLIILIHIASNFWLIILSCSSTSDEANKLGISLYKVPIDDAAVHNQLQEYSIHIIQRKLRFTAGGVFVNDRKFANFVFSTIIKYVVIFLQFRSKL